jgi:cell division protein FtsI (penicillin-binding protein 3)
VTQGSRRPRATPGPSRRPAQRSGRRRLRALRGTSLIRLRIGFVLIAMVLSVFAARLFELQGVDAASYVAKARAAGVVTVTLPAARGAITDRNGTVLADSVDGLMLVADPSLTRRHASGIATIVARRLDVDYFDVLARLRKPSSRFQYIARRVPAAEARAVAAEITAHHWTGVSLSSDPLRSYPGGDVAANLVGFLDGDGKAAEGAEWMFDKQLAGTDGRATYEVGTGGNRIPLGENSTVQPRSGRPLRLTIDSDVQWLTQRVLRSAIQKSGSESGSAVVVDTKTGQLLADADYPTYDANDPGQSSPDDLGARSLRDSYEPGSVEKVLTTSSLIDARKVTPQTKITVPSVLVRGDGHVIHDWFPHGTLHLTLTGVIARSSNIGTVLATSRFSHRQLYDYLRAFGLGRATDVGVDREAAGTLASWRQWAQINQDTIAFGQGIAVNAVQMAAAVNAIANRGVYVKPSLIDGRATTAHGTVVGSDTTTQHRVISARAARLEAQMMEAVPNPLTGTAPKAAIDGYRVSGKTGTAQMVNPKTGLYYKDRYMVSFAGFAPADKPRFTVYVVVKGPRNGGGGGSIGGPAFHKIMSYLLQKYAVPPTGTTARTPTIEW